MGRGFGAVRGLLRAARSRVTTTPAEACDKLPFYDVTGQALSKRFFSSGLAAIGAGETWHRPLFAVFDPPTTGPVTLDTLTPCAAARTLQCNIPGRMFAPFSAGAVRHIALEALKPSDQ